MRKTVVLIGAGTVWIAAHVAYFSAYQAALDLPFTRTSALFSSLFAVWTFALLVSFRHRALRAAAAVAYAGIVALTLADFAYFHVFNTFLPLSLRRAGSVNAAMVSLLKDYLFLIPASVAWAAAALAAAGAAIAAVIPPRLTRHTLTLSMAGGNTPYHAKGRSALLATAGITMQILALSLSVVAADAYRTSVAGRDSDPFAALADLGVFGYAIAAERGSTAEVPSTDRAPDRASLGTSRSNITVARDAMARLGTAATRAPLALPVLQHPPHIIVYQMESVDAWPLEQQPSPMPFLQSMMAKYGTAGEYFANGCTTVDAEFAVNCGFLPDANGPVSDLYAGNDYRCLPSLLKERGYATAMFHANEASFWARDRLAPKWGYDALHFSPEIPFRDPDGAVFDRVVDAMKTAKQPVLSYVIGFTSHSPHDAELAKYYRSVKHVDVEPYAPPLGSIASAMESDEATTRMYFGFLKTVDDGLAHLFSRLEAEGLANDTIVVAFGDHRYYDSKDPDPLARFRTYNRIPLLLYVPGMQQGTLAPIASHIDVAPTLYNVIAGSTDGLPESFVGTSMYAAVRPAGAVTKCLGRASYYDGASVTSGDLALGMLFTFPAGAAHEEERSAALKEISAATDLALKRNELGAAFVPEQVSAKEKIDTTNIADTDKDGLSDLREKTIGTDPKNPDTDGDGYPDGVEAANGFDPAGKGRWVR